MNLKQFRYVLVLSNEGSFSKAAEVLNISQPSLSQYVKKIEKEIGLDLFDRVGGNVKLTDAGKVYTEAGKKILDIEHQMNSEFIDISSCKSGTLTIGTTPFRSVTMMPMIAKRFQKMYPGMHLIVEERTTAELIDGIEHGEFDFCIITLPVDDKLFNYERIFSEELVLAVPKDYKELDGIEMNSRKYPAIDIIEINNNKFVEIMNTQVMHKLFNDVSTDYGLKTEPAIVVKSLETQMAMVSAGIGMALVPSSAEHFNNDESVKFYSFKQQLPCRDVVAVWRNDRFLSRVATDLIEGIKEINW